MAGRWMLIYGGLLSAIAALAWIEAEARTSPPRTFCPETGRNYAVDLSGAHPAIDLELDGESRYELIVSSLGDAARTYSVRLEAQAKRRVESFPAVRVTPLARRELQGPKMALRPPQNQKSFSLGQMGFIRPIGPIRPIAISQTSPASPAERRFFLHVTANPLEDERGYVPVTGTLASEGNMVRVYVDRQTVPAEIAPGLIDAIIRLLETEIIPQSRALIGEHADVDGDGKLAVLVTGWLGKLGGGKTSLNGFVRSNDFQGEVDVPFGNRADVLYLNADLQPGPALKTLLAHEYTHAVCFSRRLVREEGAVSLPVEEDWLNEAIAHVAEKMHGGDWSNLDRRIATFLASPQQSPLVVGDYYRAGLWRDPGCRGATYLFLEYCRSQFGDRLLSELVEGRATGRRNLERVTQASFADLFRHWAISLADRNGVSSPLYAWEGDCNFAGPARVAWSVGHEPCRLELRGTASAFIDLRSTLRKGVVRVSVEADPQARLQLSLLRRLAIRPESTSRAP